MNILVTGGAGYIGSHTCKALAQKGHTPVVYDNLSTGHEWAVKWGPLVVGDILDGETVKAALNAHQIDAVIHFAASAYVGESVRNPAAYYRNNVVGSLSLLDAMVTADVKRIVFSSSCATYGIPAILPITEETPQHPVNPYGETKLAVERILHWYGGAYGLKWLALRYFNAAGADPEGELGEQHDPETHLIPLVIEAALGKRSAIHVYGTDYPTPDGTAIRDYVHVSDLAQAHVKAIELMGPDCENLAMNLGNGHGYSVREVIDTVRTVSGRAFAVTEDPRRAGDPPILVADAQQARTRLGWEPNYPGVNQAIEHAWGWYVSHNL